MTPRKVISKAEWDRRWAEDAEGLLNEVSRGKWKGGDPKVDKHQRSIWEIIFGKKRK